MIGFSPPGRGNFPGGPGPPTAAADPSPAGGGASGAGALQQGGHGVMVNGC